jgi:hypothetical protein
MIRIRRDRRDGSSAGVVVLLLGLSHGSDLVGVWFAVCVNHWGLGCFTFPAVFLMMTLYFAKPALAGEQLLLALARIGRTRLLILRSLRLTWTTVQRFASLQTDGVDRGAFFVVEVVVVVFILGDVANCAALFPVLMNDF